MRTTVARTSFYPKTAHQETKLDFDPVPAGAHPTLVSPEYKSTLPHGPAHLSAIEQPQQFLAPVSHFRLAL